MTFTRLAALRLVAALAAGSACVPLLGQQQQPAAKPPVQRAAPPPAAAPAAAASTPQRGFGTARGPLLTRDELRACLSQEEDIKKRLAAHETARAPLEQEKKAVGDEQAAMRAERGKLDAAELNAAVTTFGDRNKAFTERRLRWEERVKAFNDAGRTGTPQERDQLNTERAELEKEHAALEAERKRLTGLQASRQEAVQAFNAKLAALDARVAEWNKRNNAYNDASAALEGDRTTWAGNCGNRRYREEDEIAIRSGK